MGSLALARSHTDHTGALFPLAGDKGAWRKALIGCSFLSAKYTMLVKTAVAVLPLDLTLVLAVYVDTPLHF